MLRKYHEPEPIADMMKRLTMPLPNGCHIWLGKIGTGGYAYVSYREGGRRRHRKAATVALELAGRPRPSPELEASHVGCNNRACVNDAHLDWETHGINLKRRAPFPRYRGHLCKRGHSLPDVGLRNGNRSCPTCYKAYQAAYRAKQKQR